MKIQLLILPLLLVAGCRNIDTGLREADDVKNGTYELAERIQKWALTPPPKPVKNPVPASYCYTALQDVLCYRAPMPGWENRLVSYQGTGAEAPPIAMMEPLPIQANAEEMKKMNSVKQSDNRIAAVKPVFNAPPEEAKAKPEGERETAPFAEEVLPNPLMSPQL